MKKLFVLVSVLVLMPFLSAQGAAKAGAAVPDKKKPVAFCNRGPYDPITGEIDMVSMVRNDFTYLLQQEARFRALILMPTRHALRGNNIGKTGGAVVGVLIFQG